MPITGSHHPLLIALSVAVALASSYTALDLAGRMAASRRWAALSWGGAAALAFGGGVWAMHFIAMLALALPTGVHFDGGLTALSLLVAIGASAVGFGLAHLAPRAARFEPAVLATAGVAMGLGIVAMHLVGMSAMRSRAVWSIDGSALAGAILLAVATAMAAIFFSFRRTSLLVRLAGTVGLALAMVGMHHTAMWGTAFSLADGQAGELPDIDTIDRTSLALVIAALMAGVLILSLIVSAVERRYEERASREARALIESERRFRHLVQGVTDYAIFMLDPTGLITNWNAGAERIKGYRESDAVGRHFSIFYSDADVAAGVPTRALETARREGRYEAEGWRLRRDGTRFWASVVIDAIHDDQGVLIGFAKVTRDMTERREAERKLDETRQQLYQAQKMEVIGQLTGGVAHDFNNLLAVIIGNLDLLRKRLPDDPRSARLIETAMKGAERGAALTQRMLSFARRQELEPEAVEVPRLVAGMTDLLQRSIGPSVAIEIDFAPDLPPAHVDANQFELALVNLAVNARDAMPDGGVLRISASEAEIDRDVATGMKAGRYVRLAVTDTGIGMDAATLDRAMEPFFTTKGVGKGTGLGLSMVHGLAAQSGGRLVLSSAPGQGTTAEIWLPVDTGQREPADAGMLPVDPVPGEPPNTTLRILAVDDDGLVLMATTAMIEDLGHRVVEAFSGKQALDLLRRDGPFDLVLTDEAMPGMTGTQLAAAIRKEHPDLPILIGTGYAEIVQDDGPRLPKLIKPFDQITLARAIQRTVAERAAEFDGRRRGQVREESDERGAEVAE